MKKYKIEDEKTAYAALCLIKMLYKKGKMSKSQYKAIIDSCSAYFDTSSFAWGIFYLGLAFCLFL